MLKSKTDPYPPTKRPRICMQGLFSFIASGSRLLHDQLEHLAMASLGDDLYKIVAS